MYREISHEAPPSKSYPESSSYHFVSGIQSATITLAPSSVPPRSWLDHLRRDRHRHSGNSSTDSGSAFFSPGVDERACARAMHRRQVIEELIDSEESYVADLKVLVDVYFTILPIKDVLSSRVTATFRSILVDILQLHEEILGNLYTAVPNAEYNQRHAKEPPSIPLKGHVRWHSADSISNHFRELRFAKRLRHSVDIVRGPGQIPLAAVADPRSTAAVARVFSNVMARLSIYEEYATAYEATIPSSSNMAVQHGFQRGVELLSRVLESDNTRASHGKKGLTYRDLIIKPVQRFCKYPLFFADLLKHTPVGDDPEASTEILNVLSELKSAAHAVNIAAAASLPKDLMQRVWLFHDRLRINGEAPTIEMSRSWGRVVMCGVLHVAWQTKKSVNGRYMLAVLFKSYLLLAIPVNTSSSLNVALCIPTSKLSLEETDNGQGLQCHTAPHSWKLSFEHYCRLYELMISACSPVEESQWRQQLDACIYKGKNGLQNPAAVKGKNISILDLDIKPLTIFYNRADSDGRRCPVQRTATVGQKAQLSHVVIQDTTSGDLARQKSDNTSIVGRSHSILLQNQLPLLAPQRRERMELEAAVADIWTDHLLPFPEMKPRRPESSFRSSASSLIRKLSMASITSSFSRRSSSTSLSRVAEAEELGSAEPGSRPRRARAGSKSVLSQSSTNKLVPKTRPTPDGKSINFHETPDKFLPVDFQLPEAKTSKLVKKPSSRPLTHNISSAGPPISAPRVGQAGAGVDPHRPGSANQRKVERSGTLAARDVRVADSSGIVAGECAAQPTRGDQNRMASAGSWTNRAKQFQRMLS